MKYDRHKVGSVLRRHRKTLGLTQDQVAEKIGVSQNFYARIEAGASGMSLETLMSVCTVLLITPNDLLLCDEVAHPGEHADIQWVIKSMSRCTEKQRASAVDILKAFYRSL